MVAKNHNAAQLLRRDRNDGDDADVASVTAVGDTFSSMGIDVTVGTTLGTWLIEGA